MFQHLKTEEFLNLAEGMELTALRRSHLKACPRCNAVWTSLQSVHAEFSSLEEDIVEPDWEDFRTSVRDRLLSRSVQRASVVQRWAGWAGRPAVAWALSLLIAIAGTTGVLLWKMTQQPAPLAVTEEPVNDFELEKAVWTQTAVFDELSQLRDADVESLRQMLQSESNLLGVSPK